MPKRKVKSSNIQLGSAELSPTLAVVSILLIVSAIIGFSYFDKADSFWAVIIAGSLPGIAIWSDKFPKNATLVLGILSAIIIAASYFWVPDGDNIYSLICAGGVASSALWEVFG